MLSRSSEPGTSHVSRLPLMCATPQDAQRFPEEREANAGRPPSSPPLFHCAASSRSASRAHCVGLGLPDRRAGLRRSRNARALRRSGPTPHKGSQRCGREFVLSVRQCA